MPTKCTGPRMAGPRGATLSSPRPRPRAPRKPRVRRSSGGAKVVAGLVLAHHDVLRGPSRRRVTEADLASRSRIGDLDV